MALNERVKLSPYPMDRLLLRRSVVSPTMGKPHRGDEGDTRFVCPLPGCEEVLCIGGGPLALGATVFKCPRCASISTFRPFVHHT